MHRYSPCQGSHFASHQGRRAKPSGWGFLIAKRWGILLAISRIRVISDFQILGIKETGDLSLIKSGFRKRAKELHPDLASPEEAIESHDLFTALCQAYERLVSRVGAEEKEFSPIPRSSDPKRQVALYSDQAYAFYKQGMKAFMAIHPSQWKTDDTAPSSSTIIEHAIDQEKSRKKVMELVRLFPKAYYYFSIVVHEYPDSDWAYDAREKIDKIEERIGRYRKIIESFQAHDIRRKERNKDYTETSAKMNDNREAVRRDMPKDWK